MNVRKELGKLAVSSVRGLAQAQKENIEAVPQIRPWLLLSMSFQIGHLLIIISFNIVQYQLKKVSWTKPRIPSDILITHGNGTREVVQII
jgi:hypothetical protein